MTSPPASAPLVLAWPTAGKRRCLAESAAGFAENAAKYGRRPVILITTDGRQTDLDPALAADLKEINKRYGFVLRVSDDESRECFISGLEREFGRETLEYGLKPHPDGRGWGVNVNAAMLAAAGSFLVSTDDDIFCRPASAGQETGNAAWSEAYLNADLLYYKDRKSLLAAVSEREVDVFGEHLRFLGKRSSELIPGAADAGEEGRSGGEVLVASPGTYGDSAMGRNRTVLLLSGRSREHLAALGYEELRLSRELVRIANQNTLSPSPQLMMTQTGFDDREPIPPFLPVGRNPDGLFAVILRLLRPSSLTAYLSFGLYHNPPEPRKSEYEDLVSYRPGLAELLMALAINLRPPEEITDSAERFAVLGYSFGEIAALRTGRFVDHLHGVWSLGVESYTGLLEGLLESHGGRPESWAEDVNAHLESAYEMLREPTFLFGKTGCGLSIEQVRKHVADYGRLLESWPALRRTAARLENEGTGLTRSF